MKTYFVRVLLLCAVTGIAACTKTTEKPLVERMRETDSGTLTVKMNGNDWNDGVVHAYYSYNYYSSYYNNGRFSIALESFDGTMNTGTLMLSNIDPNNPKNPIIVSPYYGQYPDSAQASYLTGGSDYITEQFSAKTTGGYVAIDSYFGGNVKGHFELILVRDLNSGHNSSMPDTLKFTEGKFDLQIY